MLFKKKNVKRIGLLAVVLAVTVLITAFAAAAEEPQQEPSVHGLIADFYALNTGDLSFGAYKGTYYDDNLEFASLEDQLWIRADTNVQTAARWMGQLVVPEDGAYTFTVAANDAVRLWIGGELLLDSWAQNDSGVTLTTVPVNMEKGTAYDFQLEWFEYRWSENLTFYWQNDQSITNMEVVPMEAFYHPRAEQYAGAQLTGIDTSAARLDKDAGAIGGQITMTGCNLAAVTQAEIVSYGRSSMLDAVYPAYTCTADSLTFNVPGSLEPGSYRLQVTANGRVTLSDAYFTVTEDRNHNDRPEHPRPDWNRGKWQSLNGWWDFAFDPKNEGTTENWQAGEQDLPLSINVPYPCQTLLSGIGDANYSGVVWYERELNLDSSWEDQRIFLCFGAVDWSAAVYIDGVAVGSHTGGYSQFEIDITDYVTPGQTHRLTVRVEDYSQRKNDDYAALVGKQDYYINYSGIWQTVYLEGRTDTYLNYAHADPDTEKGAVDFTLNISAAEAQELTVEYTFTGKYWNGQQDVENGSSFSGRQTLTVQAGENILAMDKILIPDAKLWDADNPNLYYGTVTLKSGGIVVDQVNTYFGLRTVTTENYEDRTYEYVYVNGKPTFMAGALEQAPWWDSMFTAASEDAIRQDWETLKACGFNMLRVHMKISEPLAYYWSDKIGLYIWQDMPLTTALNATEEGAEAAGRQHYEYALEKMLERDYNHPSVVAIILFNEGWGINETDRAGDQYLTAADGMNTTEWRQSLYYKCKALNPGLLVEDMSPKQADRIQPTDLNTFHMYPKGYQDTYNQVQKFVANAYPGSAFWFQDSFQQEGEPFFCSEFSGYSGGDRQYDISVAFKHQIDVLRQNEMLNGFVYSTTADVIDERNGVMTLDRRMKNFDYGQIAYGGDMTMADLLQPDYVGVREDPAVALKPGATYETQIVAMNWSRNTYENPVLHWRLDATDRYGNPMTTGVAGQCSIAYTPYDMVETDIRFTLPTETCVGVLTVWIEDGGQKIAKNFVYVLVTGENTTGSADWLGQNAVALRTEPAQNEASGAGSVVCSYDIPEGFDLTQLDNIQLLAEISSVKNTYVIKGLDYNTTTQTAAGGERASDVTILINGIEIDTVYIPDNPRDVRGALTLLENICAGASAGDFGYLLDITIPEGKMDAVRSAIIRDGKVTVSYTVKADARNRNGVRVYSDNTGRYVLEPTVILNPVASEVTQDSLNYTARAVLTEGGSLSVRGGAYVLTFSGGRLSLGDRSVAVAGTEVSVRVKLFDTHIQVFVNNDPVPVIDFYDSSASGGVVELTGGRELMITPQTYVATKVEEKGHRHCLCGSFTDLHTCESVVWQPWESKTALPNADGCYYLVNDVTLNGAWDWNNKNIRLCLNGKTVTGKNGSQTIMLGKVNNTDSTIVTKLTLCDCAGSGKVQSASDLAGSVLRLRADAYASVDIYGGLLDGQAVDSISNGGAVAVYGGLCRMYGGEVSGAAGKAGSTKTNGGAVYITEKGTFELYGGTIYGGTGYYRGGNVALDGAQAIFNMYGGTLSGGQASYGNVIASVGSVYIHGGTIDCSGNGYTLQTRSNSALFSISCCDFPQGFRVLNRKLVDVLAQDSYYCNADGSICTVTDTQTALNGAVQIRPYGVYTCDQQGRIKGYATIKQALAANEGSYLQLARDLDGEILSADAIIDLNGCQITNLTIPAGVTLTGMDSTTDDYDCADGYGRISGNILGKVAPVSRIGSKTYVTVTEGTNTSFHRLSLGITKMSIRTGNTGFGYKAVFHGDEKVLASIGSFGFKLNLEGNDTVIVKSMEASELEMGREYSLLLKNFDIERFGETNVNGEVFLKLKSGTEVVSNRVSYSMKTMLQKICQNLAQFTDSQLTALQAMCQPFINSMKTWNIDALLNYK